MATGKTAFVIGYTGAVGSKVVKFLLQSNKFSRVVLLGRRKVDNLPESSILEQKVVDFDKIDQFGDDFKGLDMGFCCLGTTRGKSGAAGFVKIEYDYVVNTAKTAKENGVKQYMLCSAAGIDENSRILYRRTKAEAERDVAALGFEKTVIVRPAFLEGRDADFRVVELLAKMFIVPFKYVSDNVAVHCDDVAKAMIVGALDDTLKEKIIWRNPELPIQAKKFPTS